MVGIDGSDAGLAAVQDGSLAATVFQDAVGQGEAAIDTARRVLAGEAMPKVVDLPFKLVTKENLSLFMKWQPPRHGIPRGRQRCGREGTQEMEWNE